MFDDAFALAKMGCIPEEIFVDGDWAILEWRDPLGRRGCGLFNIVDDQIVVSARPLGQAHLVARA
jgi:hypothetical protein